MGLIWAMGTPFFCTHNSNHPWPFVLSLIGHVKTFFMYLAWFVYLLQQTELLELSHEEGSTCTTANYEPFTQTYIINDSMVKTDQSYACWVRWQAFQNWALPYPRALGQWKKTSFFSRQMGKVTGLHSFAFFFHCSLVCYS